MKLRETVLHLIGRALDVDRTELHDSARLEDLGADVMHIAEIAMDIEADQGIEVPDDELDGWITVGDVIRCMERLSKAEKEEERERAPLSKRKGGKKPKGHVKQETLFR